MGLFDFIPDDYDSAFDLSTPIGRREFIKATSFALVDEGLSANQAIRLYRDVGAGIGNQSFREIYRDSTRIQLSERVKLISDNAPMYNNLYGFNTRKIDEPFGYAADIRYIDSKSGEAISSRWFIDTDIMSSLGDIKDLLADRFRQSQTYFDSVIESIDIVGAWAK